ncbi:MAG: hypothetical protein QW404_00110 [Candidatus Nanoarchaeia archaeon]
MLMKKGDIEIRYLILMALALIVLIVIIMIFHGSISEFVTRIKSVFNDIFGLKPDISSWKK